MIVKKETQGICSYLVYEIENTDVIDEFSLGMLSNNDIESFIPLVFTQMDDRKYLKYNISSRVSASEFFAGIVNKKRLIGVFESIADALISSDEYMLDSESIILDLDYIYVDVSTSKAKLVYLPLSNGEGKHNGIIKFFKEIMFSNQFDQNENCDYIAKLMNFFNSSSAFDVYNFKQLLSDIQLESTGVHPVNVQKINTQNAKGTFRVEKNETTVDKPKTNVVRQSQIITGQKEVVMPPNMSGNRVVTPPIQSTESPVNANKNTTNTVEKDEKEMTMFHLLMHYSKENKEKYKQQKQVKKSETKKNSATTKNENKNMQAAFSIPGMEVTKVQNDDVQQASVTNNNSYIPPVQSMPQDIIMQPKNLYADSVADFGETTILGGGVDFGGTTVLSEQEQIMEPAQKIPYLIRLKNNEKILINKPRYRLGKEKSYVDYFIEDNAAVSRSHADIVTNGEEYFIIDMNSTNHTYVNNQMIQSGIEVKLNDGDKVRLGNEEFEFKT